MLIKVINSKFETILALGIICVSVFSEEFSENLFFVILMFYGLSGWENYKSGGSAIV